MEENYLHTIILPLLMIVRNRHPVTPMDLKLYLILVVTAPDPQGLTSRNRVATIAMVTIAMITITTTSITMVTIPMTTIAMVIVPMTTVTMVTIATVTITMITITMQQMFHRAIPTLS